MLSKTTPPRVSIRVTFAWQLVAPDQGDRLVGTDNLPTLPLNLTIVAS